MKKLSRDLEVKGRRVLVRVDFNVPTAEVDEKIRITDDNRIRESLPTIELLRAKGAKVIFACSFRSSEGQTGIFEIPDSATGTQGLSLCIWKCFVQKK